MPDVTNDERGRRLFPAFTRKELSKRYGEDPPTNPKSGFLNFHRRYKNAELRPWRRHGSLSETNLQQSSFTRLTRKGS